MTKQTVERIETIVAEYIFHRTDDGIIIMDSSKHITHANPAAAALLGLSVEKIVGKTPREAFTRNVSLINLFLREGDQTLDIRLPRRRLAIGLAKTLESGQRIILLQDVTEKRDLDTRREMLVKSISHDLRNPISAIGGFADLISRFGTLNDQQTKFLTRIRQTTTKLYDMIESLVDLAWIEAGMPLNHVPVQLQDVIQSAVQQVEPLAQKQKIVIATSLQNPLPVVMGDAERLQKVIYHLLHNAITYSNPERSIAIHAWGDENEAYCSVADRGFGVADDELELIFDRMYRSRDERVRDIHGGGLGLTLARTIINRHGGDIWASSNYGEGSTFTFVLPAVRLMDD